MSARLLLGGCEDAPDMEAVVVCLLLGEVGKFTAGGRSMGVIRKQCWRVCQFVTSSQKNTCLPASVAHEDQDKVKTKSNDRDKEYWN